LVGCGCGLSGHDCTLACGKKMLREEMDDMSDDKIWKPALIRWRNIGNSYRMKSKHIEWINRGLSKNDSMIRE
jgi:hypothetical protein